MLTDQQASKDRSVPRSTLKFPHYLAASTPRPSQSEQIDFPTNPHSERRHQLLSWLREQQVKRISELEEEREENEERRVKAEVDRTKAEATRLSREEERQRQEVQREASEEARWNQVSTTSQLTLPPPTTHAHAPCHLFDCQMKSLLKEERNEWKQALHDLSRMNQQWILSGRRRECIINSPSGAQIRVPPRSFCRDNRAFFEQTAFRLRVYEAFFS